MDIWFEPPGPEPSWSIRTRRWALPAKALIKKSALRANAMEFAL